MFASMVEDLVGAPLNELDTALAAAKARRDAAELEIIAITTIIDTGQLFINAGHHSINTYLKSRLNCATSTARTICRRARLCNHHPTIADMYGTSRISPNHLDLLANVYGHRVAGQHFTDFAPLLTEQAEQLDYTDFVTVTNHFIAIADPDGTFDTQTFHHQHRTATVTANDTGININVTGGDPVTAATIKHIFDNACRTEFNTDCATRRDLHGNQALQHPLPRTSTQRRFDAFHHIFLASVTAPTNGKQPEPLVNLIIDINTALDTLTQHNLLHLTNPDPTDPTATGNDPTNNSGSTRIGTPGFGDPTTRRCATSTGINLHPDYVLHAMLHGSIRRVIVDANNVIINMGRTHRLFTGHARQAAQLLTTTCRYRGCDIPTKYCDIDHANQWAAHHGHTNQHNALPLCGTHDRWKHKQQLTTKRDTHGRLHLIDPNGNTIKPLGTHDPQWPPEPPNPPNNNPPA